MQGLPDQRFMAPQQLPAQMTNTMRGPANMPPLNTANLPMNVPPSVMSPREAMIQQQQSRNMIETFNPNIPTAESMYTPIPA